MFTNVGKGLNLELHIVSWGWAISKRGGNIEKKTRYCRQMCRAGLRKALKACLSGKKGKSFRIGFQIIFDKVLKCFRYNVLDDEIPGLLKIEYMHRL